MGEGQFGKRMSLEEIAEKLNAEKVPTIHGTKQMDSCICSEGIHFLKAPFTRHRG
jgi:hypothetical protein